MRDYHVLKVWRNGDQRDHVVVEDPSDAVRTAKAYRDEGYNVEIWYRGANVTHLLSQES